MGTILLVINKIYKAPGFLKIQGGGKKVSVVFPCYNEEPNILKAIEEFFATGVIDEIIAVDNNSKDNTAAEIKKTRARYVLEKNQGYGFALRRGMYEAIGSFIFGIEKRI